MPSHNVNNSCTLRLMDCVAFLVDSLCAPASAVRQRGPRATETLLLNRRAVAPRGPSIGSQESPECRDATALLVDNQRLQVLTMC